MDGFDEFQGFVLFMVGKTPITIGSLVGAFAAAAAGFLLARIIGGALRRVRGRAKQAKSALYIFEKLASYGLVIAGLVVGVSMLGINMTSLAVFAGALGVGIGLGLQGIVKEFVSGLVLIFEGSVQVGDYIELERGGRGEIQEVGPRATRIRNNDNVDILLPNSKLIEERVTIWSHKGATRRIHVPFQVAYGTSKSLVRDVVLEAAHRTPFTLPDEGDRKAQVWLVGFGEHALQFELLVWPELSAVKRPAAAHAAYTWAIEEALCGAGIEIPVKQLDLRLRSVFGREGDEALETLNLQPAHAAERATAAPPAPNDAVEDLAAAHARDLAEEAAAQDSEAGDGDDGPGTR